MKPLYHYTSKENADLIKKSGFMQKSVVTENKDAILGEGVYFTSMAPGEKSRFAIVQNNWDDQNMSEIQYHQIVSTGKIEYVIKVTVSEDQYKKFFKSMKDFTGRKNDPRDVHIHPGVNFNNILLAVFCTRV